MMLAHVFFKTAPADRPKALNALLAEIPVVRELPGCLAFHPFADPNDAGLIGIIHEWQDAAGFAAYVASPGFAAVGQVLRPLMTEPPVSRRFDATLLETVN